MKFFKRFLIFIVLAVSGALALGYYNGLRADNVQDFIQDLKEQFINRPDSSLDDTSKAIDQVKPSPKAKKKPTKIELEPLPINPFEKIDQHARKCPNSAEKGIKSLTNYLSKVAKTDIEKARVIYIWLCDNIAYDDDAYNTEIYENYNAEGVLKNKKAVCEGFSNLYLALGQRMGLEIEKVSGYAKGYAYTEGMKFTDPDHAWNLIKINDRWRLFDATWGSREWK